MLFLLTVVTEPGQHGAAGVNAKVVFGGQMTADLLQVPAVQMDHPATALTPQQKAVMGMPGLGTVLVERPLLRGDLMDQPLLSQLVQLAVNGCQPYGETAVPQFLRKIGGGETFLRPQL